MVVGVRCDVLTQKRQVGRHRHKQTNKQNEKTTTTTYPAAAPALVEEEEEEEEEEAAMETQTNNTKTRTTTHPAMEEEEEEAAMEMGSSPPKSEAQALTVAARRRRMPFFVLFCFWGGGGGSDGGMGWVDRSSLAHPKKGASSCTHVYPTTHRHEYTDRHRDRPAKMATEGFGKKQARERTAYASPFTQPLPKWRGASNSLVYMGGEEVR